MSFYGGDFYTISDETSELVCGAGTNNANNAHVIQALRCEGPYCDNVSVRCVAGSQGASRASVTWSGWFGAGQSAECADGEFVQGFDCSGSHCSEMRIACAPFGEWNIEHCAWTNTGFSEEESDLDHPDADTYDDNEEYSETWNDAAYFGHDGYSDGRGYFLAGIRCDGSRCDEKKFKVCRPPLPVADD
ncbi:MAG: hypothetical protein K0V04_34755 [Deltaproteobacteria bacterium]|nr:hypothetical protein [Deltaproteobacteria bacterium]